MYPDTYEFIAVLDYSNGKTVGVYFPDLPGCISCEDNAQNAVKSAKEALQLHLYGMEEDGDKIPAASDFIDLSLKEHELPVLIDVYMKPFREKMHTRYVKKTLSIPSWINAIAEEQGINFSATLLSALKEKCHIED